MGETKPTNITLGQRLKHRSLHLKPVSLDCKKVPVAMPGCTSFWKIWFCIKTHVFSIPVTCVSKNHPMWWFFSDICIKKIIPLYPSPRFGHLFMESPKLLSLITLWGVFPKMDHRGWSLGWPWLPGSRQKTKYHDFPSQRRCHKRAGREEAKLAWSARVVYSSCYRRAVLLN